MGAGSEINANAMSGVPRCPHCGAGLPNAMPDASSVSPPVSGDKTVDRESDAIFCPSCGRRVEGWRTGVRAALGGAAAGGTLPGSDEPTRAVEPTQSLLRAVALSKAEADKAEAQRKAPITTDGESVELAPVRKRRAPAYMIVGGAVLAGLALVVTSSLRSREAPVEVATGAHAVAPPAVGPDSAPPLVSGVGSKKSGKPRRLSAPSIAAPAATTEAPTTPAPKPVTTKPVIAGPLPHKSAKTESKASDVAVQPSGTAVPTGDLPMVANETVENEATPMTEPERRSEAAARADADSVRFVVKARLPQVHACYTRVFKESSPGGRVDVGFLIGQNGKASKIHTESNTTGVAALATCLEQRIGEWDFPRPASGTFELIYPFIFSPGT